MLLKSLLLAYALPIALVFHVVRTGRSTYWIFILLFIPGLGCLAYIVVEILPGLLTGSGARAVSHGLTKALNPNKEMKDARHLLELSPTVANRLTYARLLLERKSYDQVLDVLQPALSDFFAGDPAILETLAIATFEKKNYEQALTYIHSIKNTKEWPVKPQLEIIAARIYEIQGHYVPAEEILSRLAKTVSGEEAKVSYGQFLVRQNRGDEAKPLFEDIVKRSRFMSHHTRKREKEWIQAAQRELNKIS